MWRVVGVRPCVAARAVNDAISASRPSPAVAQVSGTINHGIFWRRPPEMMLDRRLSFCDARCRRPDVPSFL